MPSDKVPHPLACPKEMPVIGIDAPLATGGMELRIGDHISTLKPGDHDLPADWPTFDPHHYFKTTGEAIHKTRYMLAEFQRRAAHVDSLVEGKSSKKAAAFQKLAWACVLEVSTLLDLLTAIRGDAVWLEVTWDLGHKLACYRKNPRDRDKGGGDDSIPAG